MSVILKKISENQADNFYFMITFVNENVPDWIGISYAINTDKDGNKFIFCRDCAVSGKQNNFSKRYDYYEDPTNPNRATYLLPSNTIYEIRIHYPHGYVHHFYAKDGDDISNHFKFDYKTMLSIKKSFIDFKCNGSSFIDVIVRLTDKKYYKKAFRYLSRDISELKQDSFGYYFVMKELTGYDYPSSGYSLFECRYYLSLTNNIYKRNDDIINDLKLELKELLVDLKEVKNEQIC